MKEIDKEQYREQYRTLGIRIAYLRKLKGWTQELFAEKVGCSWSFLSQVEANNGEAIRGISLPMLFRMAEVLEIPVTKLFEE